MDFAFSAEQLLLRDAARGFLARTCTSERVAELADGADGWDRTVWPRLAELGWLDPELTPLDAAPLFEEAGAALLPAPFFSTVALALPALLAAKDHGLVEAIAAGERSATLAWAEDRGPVRPGDVAMLELTVEMTAAEVPSGSATGELTGVKRFVPDLGAVTDAVVVARGADGIGLYVVDLRTHPEVVHPRATLDGTRRLGDLVCAGTPARRLVGPEAAGQVLHTIERRALAALSCEAVGVAQRAFDTAAAHAKTRVQFGRPIGAFQAVAHRVADAYAALELARSLAYWAAWAIAHDDPAAGQACAAAKATAGETATAVCEAAIQVLGGVAITWEHRLHRYYRRALGIEAFAGGGGIHRADLAEMLLGGPTGWSRNPAET